jgi:ABC-type uncharacterized transport system permease subunit
VALLLVTSTGGMLGAPEMAASAGWLAICVVVFAQSRSSAGRATRR